jgi:hypothetical protein
VSGNWWFLTQHWLFRVNEAGRVFQVVEIAAPEFTGAAVVRLLIVREHADGQILVAGPLDLARGDDANAIGVEQQHRHHPGIETILPTGILVLGRDNDGGKI